MMMCSASTPPDADADQGTQMAALNRSNRHTWYYRALAPLLFCQGRKARRMPRDGRRGPLIDMRTWNVIIINMHQGNVVHTEHTGPVSPVEARLLRGGHTSSSAAHAVYPAVQEGPDE